MRCFLTFAFVNFIGQVQCRVQCSGQVNISVTLDISFMNCCDSYNNQCNKMVFQRKLNMLFSTSHWTFHSESAMKHATSNEICICTGNGRKKIYRLQRLLQTCHLKSTAKVTWSNAFQVLEKCRQSHIFPMSLNNVCLHYYTEISTDLSRIILLINLHQHICLFDNNVKFSTFFIIYIIILLNPLSNISFNQ